MVQPSGLPERMIAAAGPDVSGAVLDGWGAAENAIPREVRSADLAACAAAEPSVVVDGQASAIIDLKQDLIIRSLMRRPSAKAA